MKENFLAPIQGPVFIEKTDNISNPLPSIMHYHNFYELYFLLSGNRDYIIDGEIFNISNDTVVLISPDRLHKTEGGAYERILIQFTDSFLKKYFTDETINSILECFSKNYIKLSIAKLPVVNSLFKKILKHYENEEHSHLFTDLAELLINLNECLLDEKLPIDAPKFTDERISAILKYINENFAIISNIDEISHHFFLNKYYLCHFFKKTTGVSLITYLNNVKISYALKQLKTTKKSITEIALDSGYNATAYFCNTFKKFVNMSPIEYRKLQKNLPFLV